MIDLFHREFVYFWFYFELQLRQIFFYYILGILAGSFVSVYLKEVISKWFLKLNKSSSILLIPVASALGILSPLCLYGTIPLAASFYESNLKEDLIAAFVMSSILLNPQLLVYSTALGPVVCIIRLVTCFLCGIGLGLIVRFKFKDKPFFNFDGFSIKPKAGEKSKSIRAYIYNIGRNLRKTFPYLIFGLILSALFQRYIPTDLISKVLGNNDLMGLLVAATIGVPLYACGGGNIPILLELLSSGMSYGSAAAFMITGPATKITNLTALKMVMGTRNYLLYFIYVFLFSIISGFIINLLFGMIF